MITAANLFLAAHAIGRNNVGRVKLAVLLCLASCAGSPNAASSWAAALHQEHPLVGRVWSVREKAYVARETVAAAAASADFVLLGEIHDNPDHHRVQADVLAEVTRRRKASIVFEMIGMDKQPALDGKRPATPEDLSTAVEWPSSGWPDFAMYRPIFAAALSAGLPIAAGSLTREQVRAVVRQGRGALPANVAALIEQQGPLPEEVVRAMSDEMGASHCGKLPEQMVAPMVLAQRARDAQLADRLVSSDKGSGAVLIAGYGHVRADRGVPSFLRLRAKDKVVLTVAILEVEPEKADAAAYAKGFTAEQLPFDYVVFTPAAERPDPCESFAPKLHQAASQPTP